MDEGYSVFVLFFLNNFNTFQHSRNYEYVILEVHTGCFESSKTMLFTA